MPDNYLKHKIDNNDRSGYTSVEDSSGNPIFSYLIRRTNRALVRFRGTLTFARGIVGGMLQFKKKSDTTKFATSDNIGLININSSLYIKSNTADLFRVDNTGNIYVTKDIVLEGATINDYETTLSVIDPTADRAIVFPDASGTVALTSDIGGGLSFDGSTADGVLTYKDADEITVEPTMTFNSGLNMLSITNSYDGNLPAILLSNSHTGTFGPMLKFSKSDNGTNGDQLGQIIWTGDDASGGANDYAQILATINEATAGAEEGKLELNISSHDGELQPGVSIVSGDAEDEVDVTIGNGATSVTTIAGTLTMGSTAFVNNSGVVQVATQGTIDHDSLANFVANEHLRWDNDVSGTATIHANNINDLHGAGVDGAANQLLTDDGDGTVTSESGLTWDGDDFTISSATTNRPQVIIKDTANHAKPPMLFFIKDKGGAGGIGDSPGQIVFQGDNDVQTIKAYATIETAVVDATAGDEAGFIEINTATSNGTTSVTQSVISGTGHATANTVNVNLGYGAASTTTIAGTLTMGSTAAMTNAGLLSVAAQTNITSLGTLTNLQVDDVNINTKTITILGDTGDTFNITTGAAGATTLTTVDAGGTAGNLTLFADGDTIVKTTDGLNDKNFKINVDDNTAFLFNGESGNSSEFTIYENGGDSADDFINIKVEEHGATTIQTTDGGGTAANLQITADGTAELAGTTVTLDASANIELNADGGSINFKDGSATLGTIDSSSVFMKQTKVTLSESDCNSLHTTAITLVAAQGADKIIVPTSFLLLVDRDASTAQSNSGCDLFISWQGFTVIGKTIGYQRRFMYNESGDRTFLMTPGGYGYEAAQSLTDGVNQPLQIKVDSAITSGSIDSMVVYTTYHVIDNS